ncbi:serine/threonine-protein kinase, partial [Roseisolibacter sp. H3M3-2]|uniref:serine/threonine-protein kinase n=1 Tax=Roseisolibacter sp. H3M3-2 TaxID=3031323 RepID=UPI0023DBAB5C
MADDRIDAGPTPATYDAGAHPPLVAGRYALGERVGNGGLAAVYRARDRAAGRDVALKLLAGGDPDGADRIMREARTVARLAHPNVVTLLDAGLLPDGGAYLALEWVDGRSLEGVVQDAGGPLAPADALAVGAAVARALAAAHALGILHRDVKPHNVMIPRRGDRLAFAEARLADFGVQGALEEEDAAGRRLTRSGFVVGTPAYMAPEQLLGARQSTATDLFGLGAMLYRLLFGTTLGGDAAGGALIISRLSETVTLPATPALPEELRALLLTLLDREPTRRAQDAGAVAEARVRFESRISAPAPSAPAPPASPPVTATYAVPTPVAPPPAGAPPRASMR